MPMPKLVGGMDFTAAAAISTRNVWAVGWANRWELRPLIEQWNGSTWRIVPSPTAGTGATLADVAAVSSRNVWAVGGYAPNGVRGGERTLVLHWNGRTWKRVPSPHPGVRHPGSGLTGVTVVSARSVWAVGSYSRATPSGNRLSQTLILHWNGKKWKQVRSTNPGGGRHFNALYDVAAVGRNNVWAVGSYRGQGVGGRLPLVEHWNGHSWQTVPAPSGCPYSDSSLTDLAPIAPNDIWAAGACEGVTLAEHWDGKAWSISSSLNPGSQNNDGFLGITAATPQSVWAVGYYGP